VIGALVAGAVAGLISALGVLALSLFRRRRKPQRWSKRPAGSGQDGAYYGGAFYGDVGGHRDGMNHHGGHDGGGDAGGDGGGGGGD
jgi:hypothetical protein